MSYDPAEDRLLLTLAMPDRSVGFRLAQRLTASLWQALWQRAGPSSVDRGMTSTAKEWLLRLMEDGARISPELTPDAAADWQPAAAGDHAGDKGDHAPSLIDGTGKGEVLTLDDDSLYDLIPLLDDTLTSSEWGLVLWQPLSAAARDSPFSRLVH